MKHFTHNRFQHCLAAFILGFFLLTGSNTASAVVRGNWSFDSEVSGNLDGLSLKNVFFGGKKLIARISLPTVRVFYDANACGPYADRLGGTLHPSNPTVFERQFNTSDGHTWYEIGIRDLIGSYDLYQVYYLSDYGTIEAHLFSRGLQCVTNHIHYPDWRIDFDIDGKENDSILRNTGAGFTTLATEFNLSAPTTANTHAWRVKDGGTPGIYVDVLPGFSGFQLPLFQTNPQTNVPVTAYNNNRVFGRLYKSTDPLTWTIGPKTPTTPIPYNEGENINGKDIVLWYEAYLPHLATDGNALWHSAGVKLASNLGTPPPPPVGTTKTFANTASVAIPLQGNGSPYPSTINVSGVTGTVNKVKVELNALTHTFTRDVDMVLVGPAGQAVKLMSDVGGTNSIANVNLTLDSTATTPLPSGSTTIVSGTYVPTNADIGSVVDSFPAPAPATASTAGTNLGVFNGVNPNGAWKLYIVDDAAIDLGNVAGGWKLTLTTQ
jgi:subtilisin-like proprotein convertase family protein